MAKDCVFGIDFRVVPGEDGRDWEMKYREEVRRVEAAMQTVRPETSITIETRASVPGLRPEENGAAETLARSLTGDNGTHVVSYGTEAGQFQEADIPPVSVARATLHRRIRPMNSSASHRWMRGKNSWNVCWTAWCDAAGGVDHSRSK